MRKMTINHRCWVSAILLCLGLVAVACGGDETAQSATAAERATAEPAATVIGATPTTKLVESEDEMEEVTIDPTIAPVIEPIQVTYFTPSQQEGPYYTANKPADRDSDLVDFAGATGQPDGQVLEFSGKVYDATGLPVAGAVVEIWQTDGQGVYLHPNDPGTAGRDPNFQFYGESVTAADGNYHFRTIIPGRYEPRPRHIHVKVKLDGQELLTTQFYFAGELDLQGEDAALLIETRPGQDDDGDPILVGDRDIILSVDLSDR